MRRYLLVDANCPACSKAGKDISAISGGLIEVASLSDPRFATHHRPDEPKRPLLIEQFDGDVRVYRGADLARRLVEVLGVRKGARTYAIAARAKTLRVASGGYDRRTLLRRGAAAAAATAVARLASAAPASADEPVGVDPSAFRADAHVLEAEATFGPAIWDRAEKADGLVSIPLRSTSGFDIWTILVLSADPSVRAELGGAVMRVTRLGELTRLEWLTTAGVLVFQTDLSDNKATARMFGERSAGLPDPLCHGDDINLAPYIALYEAVPLDDSTYDPSNPSSIIGGPYTDPGPLADDSSKSMKSCLANCTKIAAGVLASLLPLLEDCRRGNLDACIAVFGALQALARSDALCRRDCIRRFGPKKPPQSTYTLCFICAGCVTVPSAGVKI
jgi:hypothetical protein